MQQTTLAVKDGKAVLEPRSVSSFTPLSATTPTNRLTLLLLLAVLGEPGSVQLCSVKQAKHESSASCRAMMKREMKLMTRTRVLPSDHAEQLDFTSYPCT